MVAASYMFLRRFRRGSELDGSLMIASCAATIGFARAAATDMPLASMLSIAMISWYAWRESNERRYLAAFYIFLGFATLAKGPVAPFLAAAIVLAFTVVVRDWTTSKTHDLETGDSPVHCVSHCHGMSRSRYGILSSFGCLSWSTTWLVSGLISIVTNSHSGISFLSRYLG